jgi:hypothetical protein
MNDREDDIEDDAWEVWERPEKIRVLKLEEGLTKGKVAGQVQLRRYGSGDAKAFEVEA